MRFRSPIRWAPTSPALHSYSIRSCRFRAPVISRPKSSRPSSPTIRPPRKPPSTGSPRRRADPGAPGFAATAASTGFAAERITLSASAAGAGDQFARIARRFDLAIVPQAEPQGNEVEVLIAESTLFQSGRPMILVPYIQKTPLKLDRVMVCWDGGRQAARAIADSMPILEKAGKVEVVIIADERGKEDEIEGADMGQHLARHGLKVDVKRISGGKVDAADALLPHVSDSGTDFIVMGGYGHSRLREFVLGGVTHSILRSRTAPVLMSH